MGSFLESKNFKEFCCTTAIITPTKCLLKSKVVKICSFDMLRFNLACEHKSYLICLFHALSISIISRKIFIEFLISLGNFSKKIIELDKE